MVTRWRLSILVVFISSIWHPWLMTKWHECPIKITIIKNDYNWFDMNINKPTPHLPTYLPIYLPTNPPTYLPTHPPTYLHTHSPTYLPFTTCPLIYLLTYLFLTSYLLQHIYLLLTILQLVYYLPHSLLMIWNKHVKYKTWQKLDSFQWCNPLVRIWFTIVKGLIFNTCNLCTFLKA